MRASCYTLAMTLIKYFGLPLRADLKLLIMSLLDPAILEFMEIVKLVDPTIV